MLKQFREARRDRATILARITKNKSRLSTFLDDNGGPQWWPFYNLSLVEHVGLTCVLFGWQKKLAEIQTAEDPTREYLDYLNSPESDPSDFDAWGDDRKAACLNLVIGMSYSMEAVGYFSLSINELLLKAQSGDRDALIKAMSVDRCALLTDVGGAILADAQMKNDRRFLKRIFSKMKEPHVRRRSYVDLRLIGRLLSDAGDFAGKSATDIEALVVTDLGIAAPDGAKAIRGLMHNWLKKSAN